MPTALIVGASRGIGLELCRQLSARGVQVIATCRGESVALDALGVQVQRGVDVRSSESLEALAEALAGRPLDLLIHNAGILRPDTLENFDFEALREQFEINALGPLRSVRALLPLLRRGSKIALLTSRMGSIADNSSGGSYGYRMSKAALNMAGVSLAQDLRSRGIAVALLHPGYVRTEMTGHRGQSEPQDAARGLLRQIDALSLDRSGIFCHAEGQELPW